MNFGRTQFNALKPPNSVRIYYCSQVGGAVVWIWSGMPKHGQADLWVRGQRVLLGG